MSESARIRVLIVDDEPLARERISDLLATDPQIDIVGQCSNGREAVRAVQKLSPDLLLLDIEMPEKDGFAVLEAISPDKMPAVIFVTAYDQYAVRAFEVYALDYLLKPFDRERFERALERAKAQVLGERNGDLSLRILAALDEIKTRQVYLERLVIKTNGHVFFLKTDEIDWIEAADNYVNLHLGNESHMYRETMSALESKLPEEKFLRISRSTIVNVDRIKELQPLFHGEYAVILRTGVRLTLSRTYRDKLDRLLGRES